MTILQEANSTSVLAGGLYKVLVEAAITELKHGINRYIQSSFGKSYDYIYTDYYNNNGAWYKKNYKEYTKLRIAFMKFKYTQSVMGSGGLCSIIENYLKPHANKGNIIVYTDKVGATTAASHSWHSGETPSKIFINDEHYPMYYGDIINKESSWNITKILELKDDDYVPNKLDSFPISFWIPFINTSAIKKLVTVVIHEFTHNEQQAAVPDSDSFTKADKISKTRINNEKNIFDSGDTTRKVSSETNKYALHFVTNVEQHAMAEDMLTSVLMDYIDFYNFFDALGIAKFKAAPHIKNNPSNLAALVLRKWATRGVNIDPTTNKPYTVNSNAKTGYMAQKNMIKFIARVVNTWWYDKSELLKTDIAAEFNKHLKGDAKRKEKNSTREYRIHNGTLPTVDISNTSKDEYTNAYMSYVPNTSNVLPESIDISYLKNPASITSRNNVLCAIISSLYTNKLGVPVKVVNAAKTKFDLPTIELNTKDYIDEFLKTPIGVYDTIGDAVAKTAPVLDFMKFFEENLSSIINMTTDYIDILRNDYPTLPISYFRKVYDVYSDMPKVKTMQWVKQYNKEYKQKYDIETKSTMAYMISILSDYIKFILSNNELLANDAFNQFNIIPSIVEFDEKTDGIDIKRSKVSEVIVDNRNSTLHDIFFKHISSVSFKKAYNEIYNDRSVLVPLVQKMVNDIDATFVPKVEKIDLSKQELSQLRKALSSINMKALSKEDSVTDLRIALSKLLPAYKAMILDSGAVSEKNKAILRKFMNLK